MDCCSQFFRKRRTGRSINRLARPDPIIIPKSKFPCEDWCPDIIVCDLTESKLLKPDKSSRKSTLDSNIPITVETQLE